MSDQPPAPRRSGLGDSHAGPAGALYGLLDTLLRRVPRDLSLTSLATLSTLDRTGPRRITDLAVVEGITQPSMTVLVSSLERGGLVARRRDPADGRVTLVTPTAEGLRYLHSRAPGAQQAP